MNCEESMSLFHSNRTPVGTCTSHSVLIYLVRSILATWVNMATATIKDGTLEHHRLFEYDSHLSKTSINLTLSASAVGLSYVYTQSTLCLRACLISAGKLCLFKHSDATVDMYIDHAGSKSRTSLRLMAH